MKSHQDCKEHRMQRLASVEMQQFALNVLLHEPDIVQICSIVPFLASQELCPPSDDSQAELYALVSMLWDLRFDSLSDSDKQKCMRINKRLVQGLPPEPEPEPEHRIIMTACFICFVGITIYFLYIYFSYI